MFKFLKYLYATSGLVVTKKRIQILINRLKRSANKNNLLEEKSFGLINKHVFFGYYDLNPISEDNSKILSIVVPPKKDTNKTAVVGFFDINTKEFVKIGETKTWCWQQGARLKWSNTLKNVVSYNIFDEDDYGCIFKDIETKQNLKTISFPIYDFTKDDKFGLSLNFSRLQRLRPGYGYSVITDSTINEKASKKDGVFLVDIEANTSKLIISLNQISKIQPHESMNNAQHYINHLSWNPSGSRFLFFHLWTNGKTRSSRLFTADKNGENLFLLENKEAVSHYDWKDDEYICLTSHGKVTGLRYSVYKDLTTQREILNSKFLNTDGHPTYHPHRNNILLSDTYPDKFGERKLFTYNFEKEQILELGNYKSLLKYRNDYRCDLHPRWSKDGKIISFDSTHKGLRTINIINFENFIRS